MMVRHKGFGAIGVLIVIALLAVICIGTAIKYHNMGVQSETRLNIAQDSSKVVLDSTFATVRDIAKVPQMYADDLKAVIDATFKGRYGDDGSKAVFQFIQEQNHQLDPEMYRKIQQAIESGRAEFKVSQQIVVDVKRNYEAQLSYAWSGFWLNLTGFPKVDLNSYNPVLLDSTSQQFNTGKGQLIFPE